MNHLRKITPSLLIAFICLLPAATKGQHSLSGIVLDTAGCPVENVCILTQNQMGQAIQKTWTDAKGSFSVPITAATATMVLQIQGYLTVGFNRDQLLQLFKIKEPRIFLSGARYDSLHTKLTDVTVRSRASLIDRKMDRVTVKVAGGFLEDIGTSLDLIKFGPGISLLDGHILLNGNQSPGILINGKPLQLAGTALISYLNNLKSSEIEAIEIMAYPPAGFDAEGTGGLINIRMKKHLQQGLRGSLSFNGSQGLGKYPDYNPGLNLAYHKKKFGMQLGVAHEFFKSYFDVKSKRLLDSPGSGGHYASRTKNVRKVILESQNMSLFYNLHKQGLLAIDLTHTITGGLTKTSANTNVQYQQNAKNQKAVGHYLQRFHKNFTDLSANYIFKPDSLGSSFKVLADWAISQDQNKSATNSNYFNNQSNPLKKSAFRMHYPGRTLIYTIQSDYNKMFANNRIFSGGIKYTNAMVDNNNFSEVLLKDHWNFDTSAAFKFRYSEQIIAGFLNLKGKTAGMDYQLGLRGEYSFTSGKISNSLNHRRSQVKPYFNLFPALFLKKMIHKTTNDYLILKFTRRIKRPSFSQLNPLSNEEDNYTTSSGNPNLKPQYTNAVAISYTLHNRIDVSLNYVHSTDMIVPITSYYPDSTQMFRSYQNIDRSENYYLAITLPTSVRTWWQSNNSITTGLMRTSSNQFHIKKYYLSAQFNQNFALSKTLSLILFGTYRFNQIWSNSLYEPNGRLDISFKKKLLEGKLVMSLGLDDLLNCYGKSQSSQFFNQDKLMINRTFQSREINLSIIYRFEIGQRFKQHSIERGNTVEQGRL